MKGICVWEIPQKKMKVICMGLSKTGTVSVSFALSHIGLHVAHNLGDRLSSTCDVIINTLEDNYDHLYTKHPDATWLVTYNKNDTNVLSKLEEFYNEYYKRLFSFLRMYVKVYAHVDVFHGIYSNLNIISPNLTYPFKQYNSKIKRTHGVHNYKFCPKITNNL